jgi:hypothetical protein
MRTTVADQEVCHFMWGYARGKGVADVLCEPEIPFLRQIHHRSLVPVWKVKLLIHFVFETG